MTSTGQPDDPLLRAPHPSAPQPPWAALLIPAFGSILGLGLATVLMIGGAFDLADSTRIVRDGGSVTLSAGQVRAVSVPLHASADCTVRDANNAVVASSPSDSLPQNVRHEHYSARVEFAAPATGRYTVGCGLQGEELIVAEPLTVAGIVGFPLLIGLVSALVAMGAGAAMLAGARRTAAPRPRSVSESP